MPRRDIEDEVCISVPVPGGGGELERGDLVASLGTMTRVITLAMAYVSGNVASGSGRTLQA